MADLYARNGQILSSAVGSGRSYQQACERAYSQCQEDLVSFRQQGYTGLYCRVGGQGGGYPGPGPVNPYPPNPGPFPPGPGPVPPRPPARYFETNCSSESHGVNYCYVGPSAYDVRLIDRHSDASCDYQRTYGLSGEYLWVDRGCRGRFAVYLR